MAAVPVAEQREACGGLHFLYLPESRTRVSLYLYGPLRNTCEPFAVLPRAPRKTGLGLPKGRMLRPPVSAFPPDPGLRVRGNLRGTSRPATCAEALPLRHRSRAIRAPENQRRGAIAPLRPLVRAFELRHHDGGLRAPATQTGVSAPASSKEGARPLHHAGASGARMA